MCSINGWNSYQLYNILASWLDMNIMTLERANDMGSSSKIRSDSKFEITDLELVAVVTTFRDISKQTW